MTYRQLTPTEEALWTAIQDYHREEIHTTKVAHVESYDSNKKTLSLSLPLTEYQETDSGDTKELPWPKFDDVPVSFPGGGDAGITYPFKKGCPVLLTFCDRDTAEVLTSDGKEPIAPENYDPSPEGACFVFARYFPEKNADAPANDDDLIVYNSSGDVVLKADKIRAGDVDCSTAVAQASKSNTNFTKVQVKADILLAMFGLPIIGLLDDVSSAHLFTND